MKRKVHKTILLFVGIFAISLTACDSGDSDQQIFPPDYVDPNDETNNGGEGEKTYNYIIPQVNTNGRIIVSGRPPQYTDTAKYHIASIAYNLNSNTAFNLKEYYAKAVGKKGKELRDAIASIITANYTSVTYTPGIWELTKEADEDPLDHLNVWLSYEEQTNLKTNQQNSNTTAGKWNREHVWARSRGIGDTADKGPATDGHNLRAEDANVNSDKSNRDFEEKSDDENFYGAHGNHSYVPKKSARGDVARTLMYMAVRWKKDHKLVLDDQAYDSGNANTSDAPSRQGKISHLIKWHGNDPVDPYEIRRNNVVFKFQNNRNPFVDHPELVDYIFGDKQDKTWDGGFVYQSN